MSAGKSFITLTKEDRSPAVLSLNKINTIHEWGTKTEVGYGDRALFVLESADEVMKRMGRAIMNGLEVVVDGTR